MQEPRMHLRTTAVLALLALSATLAFPQLRHRVWERYEHEMQDPVEDPPDVGRKGEFALGRLRYRSPMDRGRFYSRWGIDANKGDRVFIGLLHRLTRIDAEPIETIVDVTEDEIFNHPFLFAVSVGDWQLSPDHAQRLRQYFDRGGFLMVDDFHNEHEWANFMHGMHLIDPSYEAAELEDSDQSFLTVYDLKTRIRVPGANVVHGSGIERGGVEPHWRSIRDAKGRIIVAITFNQDIGDGWEFADVPDYPERFSSAAIRLGINNVIYAMSH